MESIMMAIRSIGLALGLICGIILAGISNWGAPPLLLLIVSIIGAVTLILEMQSERRWQEWPTVAVMAAALITALPLGYWRAAESIKAPQAGSLRMLLDPLDDKTPLNVRGTICQEPELRKLGQLDLQIRVDSIRADDNQAWTLVKPETVLVRVYVQKRSSQEARGTLNTLAAPESYGYRVELSSRYQPISPPKNPGEFDYGEFLHRGGIVTRLRCHASHVNILEYSRGNVLTEIALLAKTDFLKTYKQTILNPVSRLVSAATLGTRRAVENSSYGGLDIAKMFRHAGVGHVLAVSGLHVSVVTFLLYSLFRMAGARPRAFVPPLILFLILFALLTGARPSSVRAVIMNAVVLISLAYFRCGLRGATGIGLAVSSFLILVRSPAVLYAPSFLLSYGAVISLVLLAPPMDRWLCTFRGFSLLFLFSWLSLIMTLASLHFHLLINPLNLLGLLGLLGLFVRAGSLLNHRYPSSWRFGLERIPTALRIFFGAQLAIQIGMMVPMSAWFFGQIPVAGVLINLLAIPAIGLLVQLGMLTGLVGLLPGIGALLAAPFGAAATIIGDLFFRLAHAGATWFPFPAVPKPSLIWIISYYGVVAIALMADRYRVALLSLRYRYAASVNKRAMLMLWVAPLLLSLLPLWQCFSEEPNCTGIQCLASGRYPIVTLTDTSGSAVVINAGAGITGERLLFDSLRNQGASRVDTAVLCSPDPRAGLEGCASLMTKMKLRRCLLPALPKANESFLEAVGDDYLITQAKSGERWAQQYEIAFTNLQKTLTAKRAKMAALQEGELASWRNGSLNALPRFTGRPRRFAASARTQILSATLHNLRWLIVTDTSSTAVETTVPAKTPYDILVVPDISSRSGSRFWLERLLERTTPRVLIISGAYDNPEFDLEALAQMHPTLTLFMTGRDGAISASFEDDSTTRLKSHLSRRDQRLRPL
jgi:ComEC/Rec2-related protein